MASISDLSVSSSSPRAVVIGLCQDARLVSCWDLNSGLHDCAVNILNCLAISEAQEKS